MLPSNSNDMEVEDKAIKEVARLAAKLAKAAVPVWSRGDGYGGYVKDVIFLAFKKQGLETQQPKPPKSARHSVSRAMREKVIARCGLVCSYCHDELEPRHATIDHIVPVSCGGSDHIDNLTISCRRCNSKKGARP